VHFVTLYLDSSHQLDDMLRRNSELAVWWGVGT